jgi:uncharacterized membrane protein YtjA (UPF0391 family)
MLLISGGRPERSVPNGHQKEKTMLYWAVVFFIISIIAAIFGFGNIAVGAAAIAKFLFFLFVVLFVIALITGLVRGGSKHTKV